jgi:hypothetical protein
VVCHAIELTNEDTNILNKFLSYAFEQTEAGYVLEGVKPMCILGTGDNDEILAGFPLHKTSIILSVGIGVWNDKIQPHIDKTEFIIKYFTNQDSLNHSRYLLFINRDLFLKVVNDNLSLFRYILGPTITADNLLIKLTSDEADFSAILGGHNNVLVGILLGYGTENSLLVSRLEWLGSRIYSGEVFPFISSKSNIKNLEYSFFFTQKSKPWETEAFSPSFSFSSIEEEYLQLEKLASQPPKALTECNPCFIFGIRKDVSSLPNIDCLLCAQEKIKKKLKHIEFLKTILSKFLSSNVTFKSKIHDSFVDFDYNELFAKALFLSFFEHGYNKHEMDSILKGFDPLDKEQVQHERFVGWPSYLTNIESAIQNLQNANVFFESIKTADQMWEIIPNYLYAKTLKEGTGLKNHNGGSVLLDYRVHHPDGSMIAGKNHQWIDLSKSIIGLSKGIEGMHIGETRIIYIHPSLAYGMFTFSEKNIYLVVKVTLYDYAGTYENKSLEIEDTSFILQSDWLAKEKNRHEKALKALGQNLASFYKQIPELDLKKICMKVDFLMNCDARPVLNQAEKELVNKLFFRLYTSQSSI